MYNIVLSSRFIPSTMTDATSAANIAPTVMATPAADVTAQPVQPQAGQQMGVINQPMGGSPMGGQQMGMANMNGMNGMAVSGMGQMSPMASNMSNMGNMNMMGMANNMGMMGGGMMPNNMMGMMGGNMMGMMPNNMGMMNMTGNMGDTTNATNMMEGNLGYGMMNQQNSMDGSDMQKFQMQMAMASTANGFNSVGLPLREGANICSYFANYGECKYGPSCRFHHPENLLPQYGPDGTVLPKDPSTFIGNGSETENNNSLGYPLRPGQNPCTFFSKTGICRYNKTCKWDHPEEFCHLAAKNIGKIQIREYKVVGYNSGGYPMRPGSQPCAFYLKAGSCRYGPNCHWDHPESGVKAGGVSAMEAMAMMSMANATSTPVMQPVDMSGMATSTAVQYGAAPTMTPGTGTRATPY